MEMEIEGECSQRLEINECATINNSEDQFYAILGRENNRQSEELSFLEISDKFSCNLTNFGDFEEPRHNYSDSYVCSECNVSKSNARLLDIHVQEVHDSFFKILAERQPMYECYVSDCDIKFKSPSERGEHCISEHNYSKNCRFEDKKHITGLGRIGGKLKGNPILSDKSTKSEKRKLTEEDRLDNPKRRTFNSYLNSNCPSSQFDKSKSALIFIPRQVARHTSLSLKILENECMMD
ncbi:zinc finger protein 511 [Belonocnema kinseyi]|uniref:zinc finger protein 511 n=1 Tax=Belonocnema kinseyi TaxID=2817044 RepID=UPI00143DA8E9|nr:zinc finger protein 511 [Belonocnema kinseyi]